MSYDVSLFLYSRANLLNRSSAALHESQFILRLKQAVLAPPPAFRPSLVGVALASAMTILGISNLYDTIQIQEEKTEIIRVFKSTWAYADFFSCRSVQLKQLHR